MLLKYNLENKTETIGKSKRISKLPKGIHDEFGYYIF
jgi:hypothetical protein